MIKFIRTNLHRINLSEAAKVDSLLRVRIIEIDETHSHELVKFGEKKHSRSINVLRAVHAPFLGSGSIAKDEEVAVDDALSFSLAGLRSPLHPRTV